LERLIDCQSVASKVRNGRERLSSLNFVAPADYQPGNRVAAALYKADVTVRKPLVTVIAGRQFKEANLQIQNIAIPILENVALQQIVLFVDSLTSPDIYHQVESITLTPSKQNKVPGNPTSFWDAKVNARYFTRVEK
jgi:hypothetical protein